MKTKACTKCKKELPNTEEFFYLDSRKVRLGYLIVLDAACKTCKNIQKSKAGIERRKRLALNGITEYQLKKAADTNYLEKFKKRQKRYTARINERNRIRWQSDEHHRAKWNERRKLAHKKEIDELVPYYVARVLTRREQNLAPQDLLSNPEIIKTHRQKIILFRHLYQNGNSTKIKN
jgi:hypothetical protein